MLSFYHLITTCNCLFSFYHLITTSNCCFLSIFQLPLVTFVDFFFFYLITSCNSWLLSVISPPFSTYGFCSDKNATVIFKWYILLWGKCYYHFKLVDCILLFYFHFQLVNSFLTKTPLSLSDRFAIARGFQSFWIHSFLSNSLVITCGFQCNF